MRGPCALTSPLVDQDGCLRRPCVALPERSSELWELSALHVWAGETSCTIRAAYYKHGPWEWPGESAVGASQSWHPQRGASE